MTARTQPTISAPGDYWLFSAPVDLAAFLGSAVFSLLLLAAGAAAGLLEAETPEWAWVPFILMIDVAHVYATGFRVYFDVDELRRRPLLYFGVPLSAFVLGVAIYSESELVFWRVLAYLAVFHFVRQQYGWVALYRAKVQERDRWGKWIDTLAIYLATIYPLIYWHCHLPRRFWWFLENDFAEVPPLVAGLLAPVYWSVLAIYVLKSALQWIAGRPNPGKDVVVASTAVCWHVGIITFNSDYSFTVTNVIIHGVPYLVLVYWYWISRQPRAGDALKWSKSRKLVFFLSTIWILAYGEELVWDRTLWQERPWLFGPPISLRGIEMLVVPILAVPQLTHYVLDGFIWKRRNNPNFSLV